MPSLSAIKTKRVEPNTDLLAFLDQFIDKLEERSVLVVTSKIVSLCEGRIVPKTFDKRELIRQEAEKYLEKENSIFTIKHGLLIPASGIDESNIEDGYLLYPEDPMKSAILIWEHLKNKFGLKEFGVVITDSRSQPLRRGTSGVSIGWCGVQSLDNCIGRPDLYGKPLKITMRNVVDGIAAAAVLVMGEADEQTPLVKITNINGIKFLNHPPTQEELDTFFLKTEEDIYAKIFPFSGK